MNREFLVRIKRGNEAEAQVPLWIPLSIIAKGAAISHGTSAHVAQSAVDAIIGYGGVVANRSRGRYVDAMGEVSMASKVSALALTKAGGSDEAALAVQRAVLGWGGYLVAYIYANNVVVLDDSSSSITDERYGHHQKRNRREGGSEARHNPLWRASLAAFLRSSSTATSKADSRDYSTMTIPSSCSRAIHERKSIVDYYETNVG